MWLYLFSGKQFEETFENEQWRKVKKCNQCDFACSDPSYLSKRLKSHSGENSNKGNECDFTSIRANNLRRHLKTHSAEKYKNVINGTLPFLIQVIWVNIWNHTLGKNQINATNVTLPLFGQTIWGDIWNHTVEKNLMQPVRLCLFWSRFLQ